MSGLLPELAATLPTDAQLDGEPVAWDGKSDPDFHRPRPAEAARRYDGSGDVDGLRYADALAQLGNLPVVGVTLIVDSGWGANGDQVVDLSSATVGVGGATPYQETFTPAPARLLIGW